MILAMVFFQTFGLGAIATTSIIFGSRFVGLDNAELGLAVSASLGLGLVAASYIGHLSDRVEPQKLLSWILFFEGCSLLGFFFVSSWAEFTVLLTVYHLLDRGASGVRGALVARLLAASGQAEARSYIRAVGNIGSSLGAVFIGIGLFYATKSAFLILISICATTYIVASILAALVDKVQLVSAIDRKPFGVVFRDRKYVLFALGNTVLHIHFSVLEMAMPLWVLQSTAAPEYIITPLLILNTFLVIVFQVPLGRRIDNTARAGRTFAVSGGLLLTSCFLFGSTSASSVALDIGLLVAATIVYSFAEILLSAAAFILAFELTPGDVHGQYQGFFTTSSSLGVVCGALVVGLFVLGNGLLGWAALGLLFFGTGLLLFLVRFQSRRDVAI